MNTYHCIHRSLRVGLFGALLSSQAWSGQPLITDDTGTLGRGGNQIELAHGLQWDVVDGFSAEAITRSVPLTYTRGVTDTLDLYLGAAHQRIGVDDGAGMKATEVGWANVALGAKWRFHENAAPQFSVAVKPEILLPVSEAEEARGLGMGRVSYGITVIATQETAFGAVHFNLASNRVNFALSANENAVRRDQYRVSIAPVWQVGEKLKLALDLGVRTHPDVMEGS